jgi:hypothetical protein
VISISFLKETSVRNLTPILIVAIIGACFTASAFGEKAKPAVAAKEYKGAQQGDVQVHLNGGTDQAIIGATNTLEIWIANGEPLAGMSLGFEFKSLVACRWLSPYGEFPTKKPIIRVEGNAAGAFDFGGLKVRRADAPSATVDSILIGGAASDVRLPQHKKPVLCYTMQFRIPAGEKPTPGGFCVDNIFYPPAGSWTFNDGAGYTPTFQGQANTQASIPNAPAVCFDVVNKK